ncbi:YkvA family protein [Tautonia marina]|uniref:YkvA family protein n=1 Tax=Tautonia marina TaxID=2653855 RepID=UPI001260450A|nr:YkvA family protein [Tautonia marina]
MNERLSRWFRKAEAESGVTPPAEPIEPEVYVGNDQEKNEQYVREGFVDKARTFLSKLPMAEDVAAAYFCMLDPSTPKWVKGVAAAALAYFVLPIDAIVDAIPVVGLMDDVTVLTGALTAISAFITTEHRDKARRWMSSERIVPSSEAKAPPPSP